MDTGNFTRPGCSSKPRRGDAQCDPGGAHGGCANAAVKSLGHYEGEPLYVNTSINLYQLNTTGDMPTSVNHSNFSVHPLDMLQGMEWTGNYQDTRTVNPRDLLLQAA